MFRRDKSETTEPTTDAGTAAEGVSLGKGRPTPTRKEAEAAARQRNRPARTRKEQAQRDRAARAEHNTKAREGMKRGDERFMLKRDQGPVRRFIRDFVDSRFSVSEVMIPFLFLSLFIPNLVLPLFVVLVVDLVWLRFRVRKQLVARFPDESFKGTTYYAITRAMQMRFMRMPKSQVKIGQELPERYR